MVYLYVSYDPRNKQQQFPHPPLTDLFHNEAGSEFLHPLVLRLGEGREQRDLNLYLVNSIPL
jgi:hypothetical protein